MTAAELRVYAAENNIDLDGARTKTKILAVLNNLESADISVVEQAEDNNVISAPEPSKPKRVSNSMTNQDGVIIAKSAERKTPMPERRVEKEVPDMNEKVAVYSAKNLHWQGVGKLTPGYNILTREAADKWLTNKHVREATAEEVATYYGKA